MAQSEQSYKAAIAGLIANKDPDGRLTDAKSGLASVLQVLGENASDIGNLRREVELHKELVEASRSAGGSKEEAGPLENLAGSLMSLAGEVAPEEAKSLYSEAKTALERVIPIHQRQGDKDSEQRARKSLDELENALAHL